MRDWMQWNGSQLLYYNYLTNTGSVGVAWYIIVACEFTNNLALNSYCRPSPTPPNCVLDIYGRVAYCILDSNSATIPANYATDTVDLTLYWCTTSACKSADNGVGVMVLDWHDANYSPYTYTVEDFSPPTWALDKFYFGVAYVCSSGICFNPPYDDSYGYQMGFVSSQSPLSTSNWDVAISNTGFNTNNGGTITSYLVQHAKTIGATQEYCNGVPCGWGDAYWHDNWAYGGSSPMEDSLTVIEDTPIDSLSAPQTNTQTFTAISSRTVCAEVTNFNSLKSLADGAGEGSWQIGRFIAAHPIDDSGGYWTIVSQSLCQSLTWTYANGNLISDNSVLW